MTIRISSMLASMLASSLALSLLLEHLMRLTCLLLAGQRRVRRRVSAGLSFSCLGESIMRELLSLAGSVLRSLLSCRRTKSTPSSLLRGSIILDTLLRLLAIIAINAILIGISLTIRGVV